jgi:Mg/Co/Ni transporter MgtE
MAQHQVLDREERLVGIVAIADLSRSGNKEAEEVAIEGVSQPSDQPRR